MDERGRGFATPREERKTRRKVAKTIQGSGNYDKAVT